MLTYNLLNIHPARHSRNIKNTRTNNEIPTAVFPNMKIFYPFHDIVNIKAAFMPGHGWDMKSNNLNIITKIRHIRVAGYSHVLFELRDNCSGKVVESTWKLTNLTFYKLKF